MNMKSVRLLGGGKVEVIEAPRPEPDDRSVLVQVRASALCGSELYSLRAPGPMEGALNGGHEVVGSIAWAPPGCEFRVGQRVGACVVQGCGQCEFCRAGDETGCTNRQSNGPNGHSEWYRLKLAGVRPLPDDVDWPGGALLSGDGLGVPVRAARRLGDTAGQRVAVLGLGPVGLSNVLVQAWRGARVMGVDLDERRCKLATDVGAQLTAPVSKTDGNKPAIDAAMKWTEGRGADVVIVAAAAPSVLDLALAIVRRHGRVFIVAEIEHADMNLSQWLLRREATLMGSWYYTTADWRTMLQWHREGLPYRRLITHVFDIKDAQQAFDTFVHGGSGKVVLTYSHGEGAAT